MKKSYKSKVIISTLLAVIIMFGGTTVFADSFMPPEPFEIWSNDETTVFRWNPGPEDTWHYWRGEAQGSVYRNDELVYTIGNLHAVGESEHSFLFSACFQYLAYRPSVSQVVALGFFANGELLRVYRIDELVRDMNAVTYSVTTASWENWQGRNFDTENNRLTIVTRDDITYIFDITTGEIIYDTVGDTPFVPASEDSWGHFANECEMPLWAQSPRGGTPSDWAQESAERAGELGLLPDPFRSGFRRGTTRAEFAAIATALYEHIREPVTGRILFTDTTDINVEKAAYLGIVSGVGDNRFDPYSAIAREQAAVMLSHLVEALTDQPLGHYASIRFYNSGAISLWALEGVYKMVSHNIMSGVGEIGFYNRFAPQQPFTREQSVVTIMRLFDKINSEG